VLLLLLQGELVKELLLLLLLQLLLVMALALAILTLLMLELQLVLKGGGRGGVEGGPGGGVLVKVGLAHEQVLEITRGCWRCPKERVPSLEEHYEGLLDGWMSWLANLQREKEGKEGTNGWLVELLAQGIRAQRDYGEWWVDCEGKRT